MQSLRRKFPKIKPLVLEAPKLPLKIMLLEINQKIKILLLFFKVDYNT
jgi:hypothetical protein